ncbi:MAG: carboxypeptidase M32, partial [Clostridia bacterium]|nr:carboxypeptidase M32 [Clostridia bacterium]
ITTNYEEDNFISNMYSVIHEGGHALYELNLGDELIGTALASGTSMSVHETQSRFFENILGRSRGFVSYLFPVMRRYFPEQMKNYTEEDLYKAVNLVVPSLIRTEADEVTYCLHIMIRYNLEKRLMHGELQVKDLPSEWNRLYKEYLGIDVPNDREGVLQDSHWSGGLIGYFPSYALGSAYGAQFLRKMQEEINIDECLEKGDFAPINEWNRERIWKYGQLKKPQDILKDVFGEQFDPIIYTEYLENKYTDLYGL